MEISSSVFYYHATRKCGMVEANASILAQAEEERDTLDTRDRSGRGLSVHSSQEPSSEAAEIERLRRLVSEREERLQAIQEIGRAIGSNTSIDELLGLIMDKITHLMSASRATLFLVDHENGELWSKVTQGPRVSEIRLRVGEGIAGWVAQSGKSLNIKDAYLDERFNNSIDQRTGFQTRSCLCQPLRNAERRIIGVVQVLNKHDGYFTVEDENLLSTIAAQAAVSIENSTLYLSVVAKNMELLEYRDKLEHKINEIDLLYEIEREAAHAPNLGALMRSIGQKCIEALNTHLAVVSLRLNNELKLYTIQRVEGGFDSQVNVLSEAGGVNLQVMNSGNPYLCNGSCHPSLPEALLEKLAVRPRSVMAVPLIAEDQVLGSLEVINRRGFGDFDGTDLKLLTLIGSHISSAVAAQLSREEREKEERLSAIGQMVSSVLHDLKTPISIISGYVQMMVSQDNGAVREQYADAVLRQFDTLNRMTKEILAFARGDSTILIRPVLLNSFMDEAKQLLQSELIGRNIELVVDAKYRRKAAFDQVKLKRVFANLARNAAEAMPNGGRLTVSSAKVGDRLVFSFKDTGAGIPDDVQGRLFESFVSSGKAEGTGLGLAIVKKIVDDHDGQISFVTDSGRGTTFTVELPLEGRVDTH